MIVRTQMGNSDYDQTSPKRDEVRFVTKVFDVLLRDTCNLSMRDTCNLSILWIPKEFEIDGNSWLGLPLLVRSTCACKASTLGTRADDLVRC